MNRQKKLIVLAGGGSGIPAFPLKLHDEFTDTNATALSDHTISPTNVPSATWTNINTTSGRGIQIQSNRAIGNLAVSDNAYGINSGQTDMVVSVIFNLNLSTVINAILVRMDNLTDVTARRNCWQVRFGNSLIEIYEHNSSSGGTLAATVATTTTASTDYTVLVVVVGASIRVYIDGTLKLKHTMTTHLSSTHVGLQIGSNAALADDYKVFYN